MEFLPPPEVETQVQSAEQEGKDYLSSGFKITWERALVGMLLVAAVVTRLWDLGARVTSHDESLHTYYSWLLATGKGFVHNPMMHGPLLFDVTAVSDFMFGASDFTSRLAVAVAGIILAVLIPRLLKPWLGRTGALAASVFLIISPYMLYFSRYIRHDILAILWVLLAVVAIFRYLNEPKEGYLLLLSAAVALMLSTMEISFFYLAIMALFLIASLGLRLLSHRPFTWQALRASSEFDLLITLATLGAFFSSPIALLVINPIWARFTGSPFVDISVFNTQAANWNAGTQGIRVLVLFVVFIVGAALIGMLWNWQRWIKLFGVFALITIPLYTTLFTNLTGIGTGFIGSLGYWMAQQGIERGSQPWYYYLIVFPLYEYLALIGGFGAAVYFLFKSHTLSEPVRRFVAFVLWWAAAIFISLSLAGEKMPWLSTHIAVPMILLSGWWVGRLVEEGWNWDEKRAGVLRILPNALALSAVLLLSVLTLRTAAQASYVNYDYTTEYIDYAHGAPAVKWTLRDLEEIAGHTGEGRNIKVAYDDEVSWPMTWYLRDFSNQSFYGAQPNRAALDATVIIAGPKNWNKVESFLGGRYLSFEVIRMWWPLENYRDLTWERIRYALTNPDMRTALWQIFWNRDYRLYAQLTNQTLNPPADWPLADKMRIYIRKDVASQMLSLSLGRSILPEVAQEADAYTGVEKEDQPLHVFSPGLTAPRGLAVGNEGALFVADTSNSQVVKLDSRGKVLQTIGKRSPEGQNPAPPGTFNEPWGVALDTLGNIYVADTWNHRIQKFDPQGNFLLEWGQTGDGPGAFWGPRGIAINKDGVVFVTDTGNKRVQAFDASGKYLFSFQNQGEGLLDEPVGIAVGPDGNVYVADTWNKRIAVFDPKGTYLKNWQVQGWQSLSLDNKPYLTIDSTGNVYVTDPEGYRIIVFSADGKPLAVFGRYGLEDNSFGLAAGIAAAPDGTLWITDAANQRLAHYPEPRQ